LSERRARGFIAVAADHEDEAADGVGGVAGVFDGFVPCGVLGLDLVLAEGVKEIVEEGAGKVAGGDRLVKGDEDGMAGAVGRVVALVEHLAPCVEKLEGNGGAGDFVAEVVGDAAEGVNALEVGADAFGEEEGGDVEVLVVGGGEGVAPGAGFFEGGAVLRCQVLGGRAGE
jgi:hypothetical protein